MESGTCKVLHMHTAARGFIDCSKLVCSFVSFCQACCEESAMRRICREVSIERIVCKVVRNLTGYQYTRVRLIDKIRPITDF